MKKKHLFYLLIILSCSAKKNTIAKQKTNQKYHIVTPQVLKTYDQTLKYPFIHINGFKDFEINSDGVFIAGTTDYASSSISQGKRTYDHFVAKYNLQGSLDNNFATNGIFQFDHGDTEKLSGLEIKPVLFFKSAPATLKYLKIVQKAFFFIVSLIK